jgi:hypothetical protein
VNSASGGLKFGAWVLMMMRYVSCSTSVLNLNVMMITAISVIFAKKDQDAGRSMATAVTTIFVLMKIAGGRWIAKRSIRF